MKQWKRPPTLWIQSEPDPVHAYRDLDSDTDLNEPDRFAHDFRHAGGEIDLLRFEKATQTADTILHALLPFFGTHL